MNSTDVLINDTKDLLETTGIVPLDRIFCLTEAGINYNLLEAEHSILN